MCFIVVNLRPDIPLDGKDPTQSVIVQELVFRLLLCRRVCGCRFGSCKVVTEYKLDFVIIVRPIPVARSLWLRVLAVWSSLRKVKPVWLIKHHVLKAGGGVEV
jgi:hypothetical protein